MNREVVTVPDLGGAEDVEVIEVSVSEGAAIHAEQPLIVLESEKASMEVPAPRAGTVAGIKVKVGDRVRKGDVILYLDVDTAAQPGPTPTESTASTPAPAASATAVPATERRRAPATEPAEEPVNIAGGAIALIVPDLGGTESVEVIEISVHAGDSVEAGDPLLVMESDKASMELPAPASGTIVSLDVRVGSRIESGQRIGEMHTRATVATPAAAPLAQPAGSARATEPAAPASAPPVNEGDAALAINRVLEKENRIDARDQREHAGETTRVLVYAGPAVRLLARELGVSLAEVTGSGPKRRVLKEDVQAYVKVRLAAPPVSVAGTVLPRIPEIDFSAFGPIQTEPLNAVQKAIVTNMTRSWLNVPRVTQFDYADVTELEEFRDGLKPEMEQRGIKLTPLPFLLIAVARALREYPRFNSSLHTDGNKLVMKQYFHIGIAVDTPQGLVVPVIRDVNSKGMWDLAAEARELAEKARNRKLRPVDMQGGSFTISSLGNIGGEGFTPIINAPEVAILGVSRLALRPVWDGKQFQPRKTLPLSLSYDHRVINGAEGGNFLNYLMGLLADIRRLLL